MGATMVCRVGGGGGSGAGGGAGSGAGGGARGGAWRNGPVKGEGRGCEFTALKPGYSPTKPNT